MIPKKFQFTSGKALVSVVLVTNALVWYYLVNELLKDIMETTSMEPFTAQMIWIAHFAGIIFSAIAGAVLAAKVKDRTRFLMFWMVLGIISSLTGAVVDLTYIPNILALSLFFGISLGIGMPSCMGYFTESMKIENRGRIGGAILLLSGITMAAFGSITGKNINLETNILFGWRIFGLAFFLLFKHHMKNTERIKSQSYRSLLNQQPFFLYLIPWIMFSLITYLTIPIQLSIIGESTLTFLSIIENILTGIFAVIGGFLIDIVGRKRIAISGFVLLGLGYSVLGLGDPSNMMSWYFYTVVDGIAWGMLFVIFVVTIWGDLSQDMSSDKYYAIGVAPFFISKFLQYTMGNGISDAIPATSIFSFTAFFLFVAVLPLVYAPETLPEKTMRERELKNYIEKAQKEAEKVQKKEAEHTQEENEEAEVEFEVNQDYEEALKEAEKYY